MLGKITQKSLRLTGMEGLSFFSFPGVTSANRFKQLYRSRMNAIELTEAERAAVLEEAVQAFEFNTQVTISSREPRWGGRVNDKKGLLEEVMQSQLRKSADMVCFFPPTGF